MKIKKTHIVLSSLGLLLVIGVSTQLFSNLWGLLCGNGYYVIPNQSSIFTFNSTQMNKGSGDYWLYGEDQKYFYSKMLGGKNEAYIKVCKKTVQSQESFDKHNFKTWGNQYLCGDLLEQYAEKPQNLEFVGCEVVKNSQTLVRATYSVSGNKSEEVEDFLVKNYGMGKLKWVCCGWETGRKYGSFEHSELTKIDPNLSVIINMYNSKEAEDEEVKKDTLALDRTQIEYFTVTVSLVIS